MENKDNYRPNVAIIIVNKAGKVLWCKRKDGYGWQFPQGGLDNGESTVEAIYRETEEEVGLKKEDLRIIKENEDWFDYKVPEDRIPKYFRFKNSKFIGQTQKRRFYVKIVELILMPLLLLSLMIGPGLITGTQLMEE